MGIYDRDYYRGSERGFLSNLLPEGSVCKALIIAQIVVFAAQVLTIESESLAWVTPALALNPEALFSGEIWRIFTFGFVHPSLGIFALAFNLLFLWYFGNDLEQMYGSVEFLCFYLASIVLGGLVFVAAAYMRGVEANAYLLGALGPITAVTVLYAWHFPNHTVRLFMIIPIPMWLLVALEIVAALFMAREQMAYILAGAAFGSLYYKKQWRLSGLIPNLRSWTARPKRRAKLRVFDPDGDREPVGVFAPKSNPSVDEHLEAKVDAVLEKMARNGKESLSDQERQILLQASEIYRRRRS